VRRCNLNRKRRTPGGSRYATNSWPWHLTYTYDADGRRTATNGSLASVTLPANVAGGSSTTYNADNEQSKFNGTSLSYDADGNLTGDGTNTYTWDGRGHLTQIAQGRTVTATFAYDGFGRRMNKTIGPNPEVQFLYDGLTRCRSSTAVTESSPTYSLD
jgi:YD repeat-containing protein